MDRPVAAGEMFPLSTDDVDAEIRKLIELVTDASSSESARRKLLQLADYGMSGCISVLQGCLDQVLSNAEDLQNSELKTALLSSLFRHCLSKTNFGICFYEALGQQTDMDNLLETVSSVLKLSPSEKVGVGLALLAEEDKCYAEVEADAYFRLMFSEQMSVTDLIQMLSLFKGSLKERELSIFNCMISNLFEEYKFFPKYPEKQLKLAAVLFGSLIKHQLVANLGLGVALRAILDGLRKPTESRMFLFGATALEQFMDCVTDWPLYCRDILQISHLREAHNEIVSTIEGALANILSCLAEPKDLHMGISQNKSIFLYSHRKNLVKQIREMTTKYMIRCDSSQIEKYTSKLLKDLRFYENLILQEKQEFFELKSQRSKYPYAECQPDQFAKEFGYVIDDLKNLTAKNDKTLKDMKDKLYANFSGEPLLHQVKYLLQRNRIISKDAGILVCGYYDYFGRLNIEIPWLSEAAKRVEEVYALLLEHAPVFIELERQISEKIKKIAFLSKEHPGLNTLPEIWKDIGLLSNKVISHTKASEELFLVSKNLRTILSEKLTYATRFYLTEQRLRAESSKVHRKLVDLCREVEQAEVSYKKKMDGLQEAAKVPGKYEKILIDNAMSWRTRKFYERSILASMRKQGRAMCAFVSTVAMTESLNKRHQAYYSWYSSSRYRPDEFVIKLSEYHLQDIVTAFYANNKRKGSEKLDVCLERMVETGVVSEDAYDKANTKAMGFARYRISDFDKLNPAQLEESFDILEDGTVLIGTFAITKGYFSLGPEDVYDAKNGDEVEISTTGNTITHAVVIVGYGMTPEGVAYYVFQNWYGPTWGKDGFGKVTCHSIRQLYAANL